MHEVTSTHTLPEIDAFALLEAYGIRVPKHAFVCNAKEAAVAALHIGYPVALKIVSPDIVHKSDVHGVRIGITSEAELEAACHDMAEAVKQAVPDAVLQGFLVMESVPSGLECVAGMVRDEQLGAALMFGLGGILVEAIQDVTFEMLPVTREDAVRMLGSVRGSKLLGAYRGAKPKDTEAAADLLVRLGRLAEENPDILEMDINPFIVYEKGVIAVDARMRKKA